MTVTTPLRQRSGFCTNACGIPLRWPYKAPSEPVRRMKPALSAPEYDDSTCFTRPKRCGPEPREHMLLSRCEPAGLPAVPRAIEAASAPQVYHERRMQGQDVGAVRGRRIPRAA